MIGRYFNKRQAILAIVLVCLSVGVGPKPTTKECKQQLEAGVLYACEFLECVCNNIPGALFWHDGPGESCLLSSVFGCIGDDDEVICYWTRASLASLKCYKVPLEVLVSVDEQADEPEEPGIVDPDQEVAPVGESPVPGAVGPGPGATDLVETETGDEPEIGAQGEVLQSAEFSSWYFPGEYGYGEDFQLEAFLSDAPLEYLEALLEFQEAGRVRADVPVAYYYAMKLEEDCNQNGIPDAFDIEDGTSLDLDQNGKPDECQEVGDSDDFDTPTSPDPIADLPAHSEEGETDSPVTASDDWSASPPATDAHTDGPAIYTDTHGNSPPPLQAQDTGPSSDMCGSGAGLAAVMLSLWWMLVGTVHGGQRRRARSR